MEVEPHNDKILITQDTGSSRVKCQLPTLRKPTVSLVSNTEKDNLLTAVVCHYM